MNNDEMNGTEWCDECNQWVSDFCAHVETEHPDVVDTIIKALDGPY